MFTSLRAFANLGHLAALRTVSLSFVHPINGPYSGLTDKTWRALEAVLGQAGDTLEDVQIHGFTGDREIPLDLALVCGWLPSVAGKISVDLQEDP
jgi:hypothetical protein